MKGREKVGGRERYMDTTHFNNSCVSLSCENAVTLQLLLQIQLQSFSLTGVRFRYTHMFNPSYI